MKPQRKKYPQPEPPQPQEPKAITKREQQVEQQAEFVAKCRAESCIDSRVPLGTNPVARPEYGPSVVDYYKEKHRNGCQGRFYPCHTLSLPHYERFNGPYRMAA